MQSVYSATPANRAILQARGINSLYSIIAWLKSTTKILNDFIQIHKHFFKLKKVTTKI